MKISIVLLALIVMGCESYKDITSDILQEKALVADIVFSPSSHSSGIAPTMDFNGNVGLAFTSSYIPERHMVVFMCQHGKFVVEDESVYDYCADKVGDSVIVTYKEIYREKYKDKKFVSRDLLDYDFIGVR